MAGKEPGRVVPGQEPAEEPTAFEGMVAAESPQGGDLAVQEEDERVSVPTLWTDKPEFEAGEVGFPKLRLGQGLTPEVAEGNAKMGQWLFTGYEPLDSTVVIPIMFGRTRWKRKDPADRDSPIACQSADGKQGVGDPGGACKGCQFAKWGVRGPNGKSAPPACTITYRYVLWIVDHEAIGEVAFQRTSESYAYLINNLIKKYGFGKFALKFGSITKRGANRMWAEPQISLTKLTPDMLNAAGGLIPGNEVAWDDEAPEDAGYVDAVATSVPI